MSNQLDQLGFDALLLEAEEQNRNREFERATAHLPATLEDGIAVYNEIIRAHDAAMRNGEADPAMTLRKEAHRLAVKLNGGSTAILANDEAAGSVLERSCAAAPGTVPLWGQAGSFEISVDGMRVRIEQEGMFGIGSTAMFWLGFAVHAVDLDRPFLSETGYRSFLGVSAPHMRGGRPDGFAAYVIAAYVEQELKGRLRTILPRYRSRA